MLQPENYQSGDLELVTVRKVIANQQPLNLLIREVSANQENLNLLQSYYSQRTNCQSGDPELVTIRGQLVKVAAIN